MRLLLFISTFFIKNIFGAPNCISINDPTGQNYQGNQNKTQRNHACLNWTGDITERIAGNKTFLKETQNLIRELDGTNDHNYCRNVDGSRYPWCYVNPKKLKLGQKNWDYCRPIKICKHNETEKIVSMETEPVCGLSCKKGYKECTFDLRKDLPRKAERRMANANAARMGEFPWMVSLYDPCYETRKNKKCRSSKNGDIKPTTKNEKGQVFCGGSILNKNWIMTAAHCVIDGYKGTSNYRTMKREGKTRAWALVGYHNWQKTPDRTGKEHRPRFSSLGRDEIPIFKFYTHEDYDKKDIRNDIALGQLDRPIKYNSLMDEGGMTLVRPACIPTVELDRDISTEGKTNQCMLSGFGETNGTYDKDVLQRGKIPIYSQEKCKYHMSSKFYYDLERTQMCAFDSKAGIGDQIDGCQGDSGGPYVCPLKKQYLHEGVVEMNQYLKSRGDEARKMVQIGVVSFGIKCGQGNPGIYTRVSSYSDWMKKVMEKESGEGVVNSFQLIDSKGNVNTVKGSENDIIVKTIERPKKYCLVNKFKRARYPFIALIKDSKCLVKIEGKHSVYVEATKDMKKGWIQKRDCQIILE